MILTIGHTKGGVGKSTLAIQIATFLRINVGERVWLVDGDQQRSTLSAITVRNNAPEQRFTIACSSYPDGKALLSQVKSQMDIWQHIIIDVGATSSMGLASALMVTDKLLIPVVPRGFDLSALQDLQGVMNQARSFGAEFQALACLSCADTRGNGNNDEAIENISSYPDITYTGVAIADRKATAIASTLGLSVFETATKDVKACNEISALIKAIYK